MGYVARWLRAGLLALACGVIAAIASVTSAAGGDAGWTTHRDPRGFIVDIPPGWTLRYDDTSHKVTVQNPGASVGVIVQLVGTTQPLDSDAKVSQFASELVYASDDRLPSGPPSRVSENVWQSKALSHGRAAEAYFTWNSTKSLSVGYLYGAWYPGSEQSARDDIRKIWKSYRIALPAATAAHDDGASTASLRYSKFTEPIEKAFTVDLPATWKQSGGLNRTPGTSRTSAAFRAEIPGSVMILMGDPNVPFYRVPDSSTQLAKLHDGDIYRYRSSVMTIGRYMDGTSFARRFATSLCQGVRIINAQDRPDAAADLNAIFATTGAHFEYGQVNFTCTSDGTTMRGYVFAGVGKKVDAYTVWWAQSILAYLAKPELTAQGNAALIHASTTYRIDSAWSAREDQAVQQTIDYTRKTNDAISKIISDTYWNRAESQSRISTMRSDATRGVRSATDPYTNVPIKVDNRYANNWMTPDGKITGSDVSAQPTAGARRIIMGP